MLRSVIVYLILFTLAIPWYWPEDESRLLWGLPIWVVISVFVSIAISAYTAFLLLKYPWPGEIEDKED